MTVWYEIDIWRNNIKPFYIQKETNKTLLCEDGRRRFKGRDYYSSYEEARQYLLERAEQSVEGAKFALLKAERDLVKVQALPEKEPS